MRNRRNTRCFQLLRTVVIASLTLLLLGTPWVTAGHLDTSPAVLSLKTNVNTPDQAAIRGASARSSTGPSDIPVGVAARTSGSADGEGSRIHTLRSESLGSATGTNARIQGVFSLLTGNAEGTNAVLIGVQGNVFGNATGENSRLRGLVGIAEGQATGTNTTLSGVYGEANVTSGGGIAVGGIFFADSAPGRAVIGNALVTTGDTIGVFGSAHSPNGVAVQGNGDNGARAGVFNGRVDINCASGSPCLVVNGATIGDLAEDMPTAGVVEPGDVVVLTRSKKGVGIARTARPYDTRVAGIVSTNPRIRFGTLRGKATAPVAMVGVVPAKATAENGAIWPGDLLTTSSTPGYLMRCSSAIRCVGAIVGKAVDPVAKGNGTILVLLWRQ